MDREHMQQVKSIIQKVRVFKRLTMGEAQRFLKFCKYRTYGQNELIYRIGEVADEMFILIQGRMRATNESGAMLGEIFPGSTMGEMGVITGQTRSANIVAMEKSAGFVISRGDLDTLLRDQVLRLKVYENMVEILCERLMGANIQVESYAKQTRLS